jgi:hypothetical protein
MEFIKRVARCVRWPVSAGPFRGTQCLPTKGGDALVAKLAGTYEMEIFPAFRGAIRRSPDTIVDVGAAEGFYVASLARAVPEARVIAYEAKPEWQKRVKEITSINAVAERCEVRGFCDKNEFQTLLRASLGRRLFVLMDIEGGEFELIDEEVLPFLSNVELLVELHERDSREDGEVLIRLLTGSHEVDVIWGNETRSPLDIKSLGWRIAATLLPPIRQRLDEGRGYRMRWLHAVPKV